MKKRPGRPTLPGKDICLRLNPSALALIERGSHLLAGLDNSSPSRSAWIRRLIDSTLDEGGIEAACSTDLLHKYWNDAQVNPKEMTRQTIKIEEVQRVMLRKFECYVQSLDWSLEVGRNECCLLLVHIHGPSFNKMLQTSK